MKEKQGNTAEGMSGLPERTNAPDLLTTQHDLFRSEVNRRTEAVLAQEKPLTYSIEDVESAFGFEYTTEQKASLATIPFSKETLKACAGTHILFPGAPLSLLDIREKKADLCYSQSGGWYAEARETFSRETVPIRWHLLRMEPVPASLNKTWNNQTTLLQPDEEVPSAATVAFATMLHHNMSGVRIFEPTYVRVSDKNADGNRVYVGDFGAGGFYVGRCWGDYRGGRLGLSSVRKSES